MRSTLWGRFRPPIVRIFGFRISHERRHIATLQSWSGRARRGAFKILLVLCLLINARRYKRGRVRTVNNRTLRSFTERKLSSKGCLGWRHALRFIVSFQSALVARFSIRLSKILANLSTSKSPCDVIFCFSSIEGLSPVMRVKRVIIPSSPSIKRRNGSAWDILTR